MVARIPTDAAVGPAVELTEQQLNDAAYLRADGRTWEAVAVLLGLGTAWLAVRRAAEGDPRFARELKRAHRGAAADAQAVGLRRLKACAEKDDAKVAVKASEVLVEYAAECARNETQLKVARLRAAVEREKIAARVPVEEAQEVWPARPTAAEREAEMAASRERSGLEGATAPNAEVYLWGGGHVLNVGAEPDAADARVYMQRDDSFGRAVFWAVPARAYLASGRARRPIRPEDLREQDAPEG